MYYVKRLLVIILFYKILSYTFAHLDISLAKCIHIAYINMQNIYIFHIMFVPKHPSTQAHVIEAN